MMAGPVHEAGVDVKKKRKKFQLLTEHSVVTHGGMAYLPLSGKHKHKSCKLSVDRFWAVNFY